MIGKTISHYKILEKLGGGGMGVVYKAQDTKLERTVALKFLPQHLHLDDEAEKRFISEAKAASSFDHPNICTIYDINKTDDDQLYIAMACYEGETLKKKLESGPLKIQDAIDYSIQIANGLERAHEAGITHRDIKPANIIITNRGEVKILDFGLAKTLNEPVVTKIGSTVGTASYMSPEQAKGEEVDQRTDIWALGIIVYEMITGKTPFRGDYEQAIIYSILNEEPQNSENIDERIWKVISKSISKDPSTRYQSINELCSDLNELKPEIKTVNVSTNSEINIEGVSGNKRKLFVAAVGIVMVVVLAAVYFLWINSPSSELSSTEKKMIVVIPFANIGNELEQEYFADGMTDEMITILGNANPERLGVIGRTSAMHYKERDVTIENIGQELGVGYILEGSVRRQGEQVRIAVNLIQVEDKTQLWSRTFDGTMNEIFVLQNDVANQIAEALAVELLQGSYLNNRTHTPDPQAYEEYLTGRFYAHKGTVEGWRKAINYYEEAVRIDPEFALAYAALSHAYSAWATWNTISPKIAYDKAKTAVDEAFRLNPNLADAHSALAFIAMFFEWNWQKAEEQFRIALELNPSDGETYHFYGHYLLFMNHEDESIEAFKNALRFDPLSPLHRNCMGNTYLQMEEFKLSENSITKAIELSPELQVGYYVLGLLRERQNRMKEAIVAWERAVQYSDSLPTYLGALGYGYGKSGQTEKAKEILKVLELKSRVGYVAPMDIAKVYAGLGDNDRAFEILEETFSNREPWIFGLKVAPGFDTIRDDPRFTDLLRRIGVEP